LLVAFCVVGVFLRAGRAQTDPPQVSLADLAKKTRAEKASKEHSTARRVMNDDNAPQRELDQTYDFLLGNDSGCATHGADPDRQPPGGFGVEVPLEHSGVYIPFGRDDLELEFRRRGPGISGMLLTRSRFRGAAMKLAAVEDTSVGSQRALLVHFNFVFHGIPHDGMALFVSAPQQC